MGTNYGVDENGNVTAKQAKFGDGGIANYSEFESDGTLKFNGNASVWKDVNIGGYSLSAIPAKIPDIVQFVDNVGANTDIYTRGFAVGEAVSGALEIPHDYKQGSNIIPHIHWQGIAAPTGTDNVKWQLKYCVSRNEVTLVPPTTITIESGIDTQYEFILSSFAAITGTSFQIGDQFIFSLERIAATADEYAGDALVATVGIHYELDTIGSRQILVK